MYCYQPQHPLLRPYVKQIHYFSIDPNGLSTMTAIPTGNVFFSMFWGSGTYVMQRPHTTAQAENCGIFVSGQQFEIARHWVQEGKVNIIGFELTPHAIYQFFGVPQQEITGRVLRLEDVWCNKALLLYQQVIDEPVVMKQLAMVEHFLCERILSNEWKKSDTIDEAIALIKHTHGNVSIKKLASQLRISARGLERKFLQSTGISPKSYSKVMRFNYAFRQFALYKKHVLDVVSETGYYDQAHFVHHFHKVFGMSPGRFFSEQENLLYFFKQDDTQHSVHSLSDALTDMQKLYVF